MFAQVPNYPDEVKENVTQNVRNIIESIDENLVFRDDFQNFSNDVNNRLTKIIGILTNLNNNHNIRNEGKQPFPKTDYDRIATHKSIAFEGNKSTSIKLDLDHDSIMKAHFTNFNQKIAKIKMIHLKQQYGRLNEYIKEFYSLSQQFKFDEEFLALFFYKGLHPKYKKEIEKMDEFPTTMESIVTKCILIENYFSTMDKINQCFKSNKRRHSHFNNHKSYINSNNNFQRHNNNNYNSNNNCYKAHTLTSKIK